MFRITLARGFYLLLRHAYSFQTLSAVVQTPGVGYFYVVGADTRLRASSLFTESSDFVLGFDAVTLFKPLTATTNIGSP